MCYQIDVFAGKIASNICVNRSRDNDTISATCVYLVENNSVVSECSAKINKKCDCRKIAKKTLKELRAL